MLKIKGVTKIYDVADEKIAALDGVDIEFRKSEFVSILGPSGCGKTTLLNIIGGLDKYTSGGMEINGVSTADYDDRDWDTYRNHSVGFVFQNYNLIPHLTVLDNVELALNLVGEDKRKRSERAIEALGKVGLRNKAYKKPNQLSGGQMQRVAIARAIINDPDIILADEPTGALDSETSLQVMAILKEISKTRLVVMVTHNAELAREYSTRIVRLFDGKIVGDTNPYYSDGNGQKLPESQKNDIFEQIKAEAIRIENGVISSDISALSDEEISGVVKAYAQNIGGVKFAVLATGKGKLITPFTSRIKRSVKAEFREKKAVSGNELAAVTTAFALKKEDRAAEKQQEKYEKKPAMRLATAFRLSVTNLFTKKFRTFLTALAGSIGILGIALVLALYSGLNAFIDRQEVALSSYPITITRSASDYEAMVSTVISSLDGIDGKYDKNKIYVYKLVRQLLANQTKENVLDREMLAAIHAMDKDLYYDIYENYGLNFNIVKKIPSGTNILNYVRTTSLYYMAINTSSFWTQLPENKNLVLEQYDLIAGEYPSGERDVVLILDGKNQISDINLFFNGLDLESVNLDYKNSDDVSALTKDPDDFLGQEYKLVRNDSYYTKNGAGNYVKYETESPVGTISAINEEIRSRVGGNYTLNFFRGDKKDSGAYTYDGVFGGSLSVKITGIIKLKDDISIGVLGTNAIGYTKALTDRVISWAWESNVVQEILAEKSSEWTTDTQLSDNMRRYGYAVVPNSISIYCKNYDGKTAVKAELKRISEERKAEGKSEIIFSDLMSVVLSVVQQFINIITMSLLCLTAISLIVSALMIGIITYDSVLERTREIGVLRALGARKLDISRIFNAETVIIGLISGILGVVITYIASWPLGSLIARFTGIGGLVSLPWYFAVILVFLSTMLTLVAGLIPAGIAKRKDPVKALRAE